MREVENVTEEYVTGKLDRVISEMFYLVDNPRDEITDQTIKHHAEDMILAGQTILTQLSKQGRISKKSGAHHEQMVKK
jgi:hypothetical protein